LINLFKYSPQADLLKDKVIMISGSSSGVGKEAAITFAKFGSQTILLARNNDLLEETYNFFVKKNIRKPMLHTLDFNKAEEKDYIALSEAVIKEYGKLDGLLNNAGILGDKSPIENYGIKKWREVMKVNLESSFLLTKSLLPALKRPNHSSIIFTSSGVGRKGKAYWGAYAISKFAIEGLVQILSEELKKTSGIRVNAINPGRVQTKMRAEAYPAEDPTTLPSPREVMNAYLFLMGDDSLGISGKSIDA
tara:strand:+ start:1967 stop:2713 length:747 start_codon:yes stop_codon:yes gene_type:complete